MFFALTEIVSAQTVLQNGVSVSGLAGARHSHQFFKITVPVGESKLEIKLSATVTTGDCDLYVKFGSQPTLHAWDYRPYTNTSDETVTVANPAAGDWYVMLDGYTAYAGLSLIATYPATQGTVATPTFNVASGTYTGNTIVSMATATSGAMIRYTTDGSDPTSSSTVYSAPVIISSSLTLKARGFRNGLTQSGVASANYTIVQSNVAVLQNGVARTNLAGARNSQTAYKIFVPAGQTSLVIKITGISGSGDCDLYVKHGAQPTLSTFDYRPYLDGANETVSVASPAGGDWYIMLHGYTSYSGVSLVVTYSASATALPDLVPVVTNLNAYTTTESFTAGACDALEGLVATGTRRLLRFTTETRNIGTSDLVLRSPVNNPLFVYAPCHGHYHFNNFAEYLLLNAAGQTVAAGQKVGFCLEDVSRWNPAANSRPQYNCDYQGIQAGWSDLYTGNLPGQWIDITGVAPGNYILQIKLDNANRIPEANESNNTARVQVTIQASNGRVVSQQIP